MSDTITLTPVTDLLPGDMLDLEGDSIASLCNGDECTEDIPCHLRWEFEYAQVSKVYNAATFDEARRTEHLAGRNVWASGLTDFVRPSSGQIGIHLTDDTWIFFPADHEVKVSESVTDSGEWLHAVDLMLERIVTEGDPSWGELADAQGEVQTMLVKLGSIDAVIATLETDR